MDAFEFNKIVGAALAALLVIFATRVIVNENLTVERPEVEGHEASATGGVASDHETKSAAEMPAEDFATLLAKADPKRGRKTFKKCASCHSIEKDGKNKVGPNLHGAVGRKRASIAGFAYSKALTEMGGAWSYETLNTFLTKPKAFVPGTKMAFSGIKNTAKRAELIAFLRANTESPPALPKPMAANAGEPAKKASASPTQETKASPTKTKVAGIDSASAATGAGDAVAGKKNFRRCKACHTIKQGGGNRTGPNLYGVVGRPIASVSNFKYSAALKAKGGNWDAAKLDQFLTKPKKFVPGTKMTFAGLKKAKSRADLIAYLENSAAK